MRYIAAPVVIILTTILFGCKKEETALEPKDKVLISGMEYPTVQIGNQIWTSVNYGGDGGISYSQANSKPEYGRYYSFTEMQQVSLPQGWRIPTEADFKELTRSVGVIFNNSKVENPELIKKLVSKANWKNVPGDNSSGFNAYPGGYSVNNSSPMDGDLAEFWMQDGKTFCIMESGNFTAHRIVFFANSNQPLDRFNLRFVKDAN